MQCPICKAAMRCKRSIPVNGKVIREYRCTGRMCQKKFMSEELVYIVQDPKGRELDSELNKVMYERYEKTPPEMRKPIPRPPKKKRKIAPEPSTRVEGEVYLTYGEIIKKWQRAYSGCVGTDFRPYPLLDYSIIVWVRDKDGIVLEFAYQYIPENDNFIPIEGAKTYEEILAEKGRK